MIWTNIEEMPHPTNLVIRPFPQTINNDEMVVTENVEMNSKFLKKVNQNQDDKKFGKKS